MTCSGVPQPWDGRCWKRPSESRSPDSMLYSFDSWYAVASAIVAARAGMPRWTETAVISAAFSACSTLSFTSRPSTVPTHSSLLSSGPTLSKRVSAPHTTTPMTTTPTPTTTHQRLCIEVGPFSSSAGRR